MTALREAIVLPMLFLTVALVGGLRIAADVRLVPPPLMAMVLGMLLMGSLYRAGALAPDALMHARRTPLENTCGLVVILSLYAASTQVFHLLTPETGLLHVVFSVYFFVQLLATAAGGTGRSGLLRTLGVLFGAAFILRWIVLESLYAPDATMIKRLVTALAEGATLGALEYTPHTAANGYAAFVAVAMFLAGLALLPGRREQGLITSTAAHLPMPVRSAIVPIVLALASFGCGTPDAATVREQAAPPAAVSPGEPQAAAIREQALRRARVWFEPRVPPRDVDFAANPPDGFQPLDDVACRFVVEPVGGTTPKFNCQLPGGEILKVKYGHGNPEQQAEVAATRLLSALGFGADRMFVVRSVRCAGCPALPFQALQCHARTKRDSCFGGALDYGRIVEFAPAALERRLEGRRIEAVEDQGWAWFELDRVDASAGGASRAEIDALRLMAVLLAHWDNKGENQRLVCLPGGDEPDGGCSRPLALMQDLGATFGPLKVDLANWRRTPVWADAATCTVSMKSMPWGGATFPDRRISEEGRRLLVRLLEQLSERQLRDLFVTSGISTHDQFSASARDPMAWVLTFREKVRQIASVTCPPAGA